MEIPADAIKLKSCILESDERITACGVSEGHPAIYVVNLEATAGGQVASESGIAVDSATTSPSFDYMAVIGIKG